MADEEARTEGWEDADDLCRVAADAGFEVNRDTLRRFHRAGVISRPEQRHLGARGSKTLYPLGTSAVLLEACELHRTERRLSRVAWTMWWRGLAPTGLAVRMQLEEFARSHSEAIHTLVDEGGGLTTEARRELDQAATVRLPKPLGRIRRRVKSDHFGDVMRMLTLVVSGQTAALSPEDLEKLEHAMGMDRARTDVLGDIGRPWLDGDIRDDMAAIGDIASPAGLADVLAEVSDAEIDAAREEVKKFAAGIGGVAYALRLFGSEWAYGIGGWGLFIDQMLITHDGQAYLVLIWLRILQAGLGPGATEVLTELETQPGLREQVDLLAGLFDAIPELRQAFPTDWYERALRDPSYQERINATCADLRLEYGDEIDAYFKTAGKGLSQNDEET